MGETIDNRTLFTFVVIMSAVLGAVSFGEIFSYRHPVHGFLALALSFVAMLLAVKILLSNSDGR